MGPCHRPRCRIILVEANSESLSDLMASVATAAGESSVSVVSMSWGFAEGQAVFASDEAFYDGVFDVPGVTFVASTGDYGAADPEYPAFSPNVVAVGGTSLILNADIPTTAKPHGTMSPQFAGDVDRLGRRHQPLRTRTGLSARRSVDRVAERRPTSRWSAIRPPAPGSPTPIISIPSNPFEVAGGTSLASPAFAGLARPWSIKDGRPRARRT